MTVGAVCTSERLLSRSSRLLDDLHVQHAQKPAAEPEAERVGRLGLEREARIVERQFLEGGPQVVELVVSGREKPAEDDRHGLLVSGQGHLGRPRHLGDRVADADVGEPLDVGDDVADLPDAQLVAGDLARPESAKSGHLVVGPSAIRRIDWPTRRVPSTTRT